MPTIIERFARTLLGKEQERLEETTRRLLTAYLEGPYLLSPQDLLTQLQEVDSSLLQDFIHSVGYDLVGSLGYGETFGSEAERLRAVDESRRLYRYDVITQWIIWLWTNFGFGENVEIVPEDENAEDPWTEFWEADRNQSILADDSLHFLSEDLLVDGEKFLLLFISTLDGECTIREVDTKEIVEIVTHPEDQAIKLFYKRNWSTAKGHMKEMYYPDYLALITGMLEEEAVNDQGEAVRLADVALPKGAVRADLVKENTLVCCLHVAHNRKGGVRGWPLMSAGAPWSRAHKKFREDRAAVTSAVAMFVRKVQVKGGSRAVTAMRDRLNTALSAANAVETNPPPVAGSTWFENPSAEMSNLSLGTGSGDAKADGESLLLMAGLGGGVYPHWMGAGDAYRLATASSMESPMYREFSRYQKFWSSQFRKMARVVLWAQETYNGKSFETYEVQVSTDKLLQTDLGALVSGLGSTFSSLLTPYADKIPVETQKKLLSTAWGLVLQTLGVSDEDLSSDEAFGVGVEAAASPPAASPAPAAPTPPPAESAAFLQFRRQVREAYEKAVALKR